MKSSLKAAGNDKNCSDSGEDNSMKIRFEDFTIKQCTTNHLDEIVRLQDEVLAGLPSPEFLRANTVEMLEECLRPPHYTVGAWYGEILAGVSVLYYPYTDKENLSLSLVTVDASGLKTANNKLCMVRKEYRGNSLQYRLGLLLERHAVETGVQLLCTTVSPKNEYSINNILRLGFKYDRTLIKYGYERNLYYKFL
jgi:hypothetical protein